MYVETIRGLYSLTNDQLRLSLRARLVQFRRHDNKAVLVELIIVDMLRVRVASGARSSGAMIVDPPMY